MEQSYENYIITFRGGGTYLSIKRNHGNVQIAIRNYSIHLSQSCSETYSEEITHSALQYELSERRRRAHA